MAAAAREVAAGRGFLVEQEDDDYYEVILDPEAISDSDESEYNDGEEDASEGDDW